LVIVWPFRFSVPPLIVVRAGDSPGGIERDGARADEAVAERRRREKIAPVL